MEVRGYEQPVLARCSVAYVQHCATLATFLLPLVLIGRNKTTAMDIGFYKICKIDDAGIAAQTNYSSSLASVVDLSSCRLVGCPPNTFAEPLPRRSDVETVALF